MREYQVLLTGGGILCDGEVVGLEHSPFTPSVSPGGRLTKRPFQPLGRVAVLASTRSA